MKLLIPFFCILLVFSSCASTASKNPNMIADADPIPLGTVTILFEKFFSSALGTKDVSLVFDPRSNTVYLQFVYETVTYRQFWDQTNRKKFIAALEQYQKDFEARNLNRKSSKSRRAYGSVNGKTEWGQFSFSINARSYPQMEIGYQFKEDNPYFTVLQREAKDTLTGDERNSLRITTYFNRTQAAELAAFFDQTYLLNRLEAEGIPLASDAAPDVY
ncbi:MAG: hypothetical protein LBD55_00605 [Treponema sp.]|jgi:hypothetical protein|nr:hypothetical protein [Treponema sp.]